MRTLARNLAAGLASWLGTRLVRLSRALDRAHRLVAILAWKLFVISWELRE